MGTAIKTQHGYGVDDVVVDYTDCWRVLRVTAVTADTYTYDVEATCAFEDAAVRFAEKVRARIRAQVEA